MCGIGGFFRPSGEPDAENLLERMASRMLHRGPDAGGKFITPDHRVGLCHRRLAILDLSPTGAQPMRDEEAALVLSFNGEIFNYREIAAELSSLGYRFNGTSDTEVILNSSECSPSHCGTAWRGSFSSFGTVSGSSRCTTTGGPTPSSSAPS
jgi:asparagine synthase (glutamine-hydrolysing)